MEVIHDPVDTLLEIGPSSEVSMRIVTFAKMSGHTHVLSISSRSGVAGKLFPREGGGTMAVEMDGNPMPFSGSTMRGRTVTPER